MKAKVLLNDYAGHPFQVELSRWLSTQGATVKHVYCASVQTPRGAVNRNEQDSSLFQVSGIDIGKRFEKYGLLSRWRQERQIGRAVADEVDAFRPDIVISANMPLEAQNTLLKTCARRNIPLVIWLQDILSIGIDRALQKRIPFFGKILSSYFKLLERTLCRKSAHVVAITEDFLPFLRESSVDKSNITVIQNWAPLHELQVKGKDNQWARAHNLNETNNILYSGTLGLKHNPDLLARLAERFRDEDSVRILVVTEGEGEAFLRRAKTDRNLENLIILPYQAYDDLPNVLGAADVLVALLEADAGEYSVPSKVLSYLCAKRALLLSVPPENLAARVVREARAGIAVSPSDCEGFLISARILMEDGDLRASMSNSGREYAERHFDIDVKGAAFSDVIEKVVAV